jgi:hypothetical protein
LQSVPGLPSRGEFEAVQQLSVEDALRLHLVECECPLEYRKRNFVSQAAYDVCDEVCLGSGRFSSAVPEAMAISKGLREMRTSNVEICLLCRDSEQATLSITRRLFHLFSFFNSAHVTVIINDSEDDSLAAVKTMMRLFGGPGQRYVAIDVEGFSLQMRRPPVYSFRYPPKRMYDSASFARQRATRYDRMSILGNRCLQRVLRSSYQRFMIMMDADIDMSRDFLDVDGIAHSFGMRLLRNVWKWNIVCK